jgi:hypothetical protein
VDDEPQTPKKPKKVVRRGMSLLNISQMESNIPMLNDRKYHGANLAFNQKGDFNKYLDEDEMIKFYEDVVDNKMQIPDKKSPRKFEVVNGGDSPEPGSLD